MAEIRDGEVRGGEGEEAHTSMAGDSRGQLHGLAAPVAQGSLKHFLTFKCVTVLHNTALPISFFLIPAFKAKEQKSFLRQKQNLSKKSPRICCRKLYLIL